MQRGHQKRQCLALAAAQQANRLADQFKTHPEQVYNGVLDVLLTDFDEKE